MDFNKSNYAKLNINKFSNKAIVDLNIPPKDKEWEISEVRDGNIKSITILYESGYITEDIYTINTGKCVRSYIYVPLEMIPPYWDIVRGIPNNIIEVN